MIVIVDIDGTCSDPTHRLHHIKGAKKNWNAFHDEVGKDECHDDIRQLVWILSRDHFVLYMSGRMERCRQDTLDWLAKWGFPAANLHMRADEDYRPDYVVKSELADRLGLSKDTVLLALDDRQQVVDMWRSRGIRCLQVAKGDF